MAFDPELFLARYAEAFNAREYQGVSMSIGLPFSFASASTRIHERTAASKPNQRDGVHGTAYAGSGWTVTSAFGAIWATMCSICSVRSWALRRD